MQSIRFIAALLLFFLFCGPVFGQYLDFQQNINGCLNRNELATCIWLRSNWTRDQTPEQKQQIEAKIKAIQSGTVQRIPQPPGMSPYDDLERGLKNTANVVGTIFQVIFFLLFAGGAFWFLKKMLSNAQIRAERPKQEDIPAFEEGPMKVDIAFQQVPAKSQSHRLYGGDNWWRMHMNIRMSNKDWALFEKSGMMEREMFSHPGVQFPEIETSFSGLGLRYMPSYRDFPDIQTAEAAKEALIRNLHIVRGRLDDMKSSKGGINPERIEI